MPESPDRLRAVARRTGLSLYFFALATFGVCGQLFVQSLTEYSGPMRMLFIVAMALFGIGLPATMILMGSELRAAARAYAA
jgi:hypothetical protein